MGKSTDTITTTGTAQHSGVHIVCDTVYSPDLMSIILPVISCDFLIGSNKLAEAGIWNDSSTQ